MKSKSATLDAIRAVLNAYCGEGRDISTFPPKPCGWAEVTKLQCEILVKLSESRVEHAFYLGADFDDEVYIKDEPLQLDVFQDGFNYYVSPSTCQADDWLNLYEMILRSYLKEINKG